MGTCSEHNFLPSFRTWRMVAINTVTMWSKSYAGYSRIFFRIQGHKRKHHQEMTYGTTSIESGFVIWRTQSRHGSYRRFFCSGQSKGQRLGHSYIRALAWSSFLMYYFDGSKSIY